MIIIGINYESNMAQVSTNLIEAEKILKVAQNIIATRRIADTSKLIPISISYDKIMPFINEKDTIKGIKVGETMQVRFFRKKGNQPDSNSILTIWEPIVVYLENNYDTSKVIVKIEPAMTTGGKGYQIKNK